MFGEIAEHEHFRLAKSYDSLELGVLVRRNILGYAQFIGNACLPDETCVMRIGRDVKVERVIQ